MDYFAKGWKAIMVLSLRLSSGEACEEWDFSPCVNAVLANSTSRPMPSATCCDLIRNTVSRYDIYCLCIELINPRTVEEGIDLDSARQLPYLCQIDMGHELCAGVYYASNPPPPYTPPPGYSDYPTTPPLM